MQSDEGTSTCIKSYPIDDSVLTSSSSLVTAPLHFSFHFLLFFFFFWAHCCSFSILGCVSYSVGKFHHCLVLFNTTMPAAHAFSDPLSEANRVFKTTFIQGPYSAYNMLDYLRQKAGVSWEDVLRHGIKRALGSVTRQDILNDKTPAFEATWRGVAGRCTSFAVQVTTILHARYPGVFDFDIYDLGKHRVARCKKTSILIDSSANQGAILLPEGHWVRMEGSDASWKWSKGKSKFERCENAKMVSESCT